MKIDLHGEIIPNDMKWVYDYYGFESTAPSDIKNAINQLSDGEELEVYINSVGGDVQAGQEIYNLFASVPSVANIIGFAASAAGVAAMGCRTVRMSDVATVMIHNVWCGGVEGDYHDMDKASKMLKTLNESMANAYAVKSGMPVDKVLSIMDKETWLTARECLEYGFIDEIIKPEKPTSFINSFAGLSVTEDMINEAKKAQSEKADAEAKAKAELEAKEALKKEILSDIDFYGL